MSGPARWAELVRRAEEFQTQAPRESAPLDKHLRSQGPARPTARQREGRPERAGRRRHDIAAPTGRTSTTRRRRTIGRRKRRQPCRPAQQWPTKAPRSRGGRRAARRSLCRPVRLTRAGLGRRRASGTSCSRCRAAARPRGSRWPRSGHRACDGEGDVAEAHRRVRPDAEDPRRHPATCTRNTATSSLGRRGLSGQVTCSDYGSAPGRWPELAAVPGHRSRAEGCPSSHEGGADEDRDLDPKARRQFQATTTRRSRSPVVAPKVVIELGAPDAALITAIRN